jgi:hypothetical protein
MSYQNPEDKHHRYQTLPLQRSLAPSVLKIFLRKIHLNVIHPTTSRSFKWSLFKMFSDHNSVDTFSICLPTPEIFPVHLILHFIILQTLCIVLKSQSSTLHKIPNCPFTSTCSGPNNLQSTSFPNACNSSSFFQVINTAYFGPT